MNAIKIFKEQFKSHYEKMKETEHGYNNKPSPYHLEGDVWTHTEMVYNYLKTHYKKVITSEHDYNLLKVACLFHDIGKPYVWKEVPEKGKRYFFGHWNMSFYIVCDMLSDESYKHFGLTSDDVKLIAMLVLNHHRRFESNLTNFEFDFINKKYTYLLNILTECDMNGRIGDGTNEDNIDLISMDTSHLKELDSNKPSIFFMVGPPCCGKSTYMKKQSDGKSILSRDDIVMELSEYDTYTEAFNNQDSNKVNNELNNRYRELITKGEDFYIDMTNMNKKGRKKFHNDNFNSVAIVFFTGYKDIIIRNDKRGKDENKFIPVNVINNFINNFWFGYLEEFNEVLLEATY